MHCHALDHHAKLTNFQAIPDAAMSDTQCACLATCLHSHTCLSVQRFQIVCHACRVYTAPRIRHWIATCGRYAAAETHAAIFVCHAFYRNPITHKSMWARGFISNRMACLTCHRLTQLVDQCAGVQLSPLLELSPPPPVTPVSVSGDIRIKSVILLLHAAEEDQGRMQACTHNNLS